MLIPIRFGLLSGAPIVEDIAQGRQIPSTILMSRTAPPSSARSASWCRRVKDGKRGGEVVELDDDSLREHAGLHRAGGGSQRDVATAHGDDGRSREVL